LDEKTLRAWLQAFKDGKLPEGEFVRRLKNLPYQDLKYAKVDHHRALRRGFPEVIYGESKDIEQILTIAEKLQEQGTVVLITRLDGTKIKRLQERYPEASVNPAARTVTLFPPAATAVKTAVRGLVITAGTADIPVAEEAAATVEAFAYSCDRLYDVGVAGLHRLMAHREQIERADAVVVAAGMEGALPSVVAGLVDVPVIAVPTSVGYGASFGGIAALLSMLTGCAGGVAVVNIDSGFAAGFMLAMILRNLEKKLERAGT
jgi:NCAIR mutase (PurE)-related protein